MRKLHNSIFEIILLQTHKFMDKKQAQFSFINILKRFAKRLCLNFTYALSLKMSS